MRKPLVFNSNSFGEEISILLLGQLLIFNCHLQLLWVKVHLFFQIWSDESNISPQNFIVQQEEFDSILVMLYY